MATFNAGAIEATLDLDVDPFQRGIAQARAEGKRFAAETFSAKVTFDAGATRSDLAVLRQEFQRVAKTYTARVDVDGLGESIGQVQVLRSELDRLDGERHTLDVDTSAATSSVSSFSRGIRGMIAALAVLSTAAIPLSAAAVPVVGIANNLTLAGAGIGTVALAVMSTLPAFKAVNKAGLEPTAENLEAMRAALDKLNPQAREFIDVVHGLGPGASALRNAAQAGFFPSVNRALSQTDLRDYQGLVFELSDTMGDLAGHTINALDNPRWQQFFGFVKAEARPGIDALGDSVGNLAGFFASLWQAFDPVNDDFSAWLVDATGRARDWADSLKGSPEFEDFLAYVRESGPEAADTLKALGGAFVDVIEAAAPLGGVVLDVLEGVGNAISFIADTPFGDEILLGAAALWTLNKALAATSGLMARMGFAGAAGAAGGAAAGGAARGGMFAMMGGSIKSAMTPLSAAERAKLAPGATGRQAASARGVAAGGAAGVAAVTLLATGAGDAIGLTNTAMLGLAGSMAGPPGAAIGATVGLFLDLKSAANEGADAVDSFNSAVANVSSVSEYGSALEQMQQSMKDRSFLAKNSFELESAGVFGLGGAALAAVTGDKDAQAQRDAAQAAADYEDLQEAARGLADAQGMAGRTTEDLDAALQASAPAMNALNISTDDLIAAASSGGLDEMVDKIERYQTRADSAAGRTKAFADSVSDLANEALSTADSAAQMGSALEALLMPALTAEQATDAWHTSLRELEKTLKEGAGFKGFSKAAMANRQVTRDYVTTSMERLKALAGLSTTSEKDMANAVAATRKEFIQSGIAAGMSKKAMIDRANAMGLTPKMVRTVFEAAGIDAADLRARHLRELYKGMPKNVRTDIRANGIPETSADVDALVKKYHLTEKQRQALITLKDLASKNIGDVLEKLGIVDRFQSMPSVALAGGAAVGNTLANITSWLTNLDGKTATTWVTTRHVNVGGMGPQSKAYGGAILGFGGPTQDNIPIMASAGEHMWTAREVANAGGHAAVEAIRAQFRYASGGAIPDWRVPDTPRSALSGRQWAAVRESARNRGGSGLSPADVDRIVRAIEDNRGVYAPVSSKEDVEHALRALDAELRR